jgi:hypothetical protein
MSSQTDVFDLHEEEADRILEKAARYADELPVTVRAELCDRSEGGPHDYYSEGDYWWPDPGDPDGPYIRRDGETNPDLFYAHRHALVRLSEIIGTLASAHLIKQDPLYLQSAMSHLSAWFVDSETCMNPSLLYGQAIKGRDTGRSIGIIDTLHLTEVALGAQVLFTDEDADSEIEDGVRNWFRTYLDWINSHPYGLTEKVHPNNHGVCWSMQAAAFACLVDDQEILDWVRAQFKSVYLSEMMDDRGAFPAELARTKPYGYSLFVIDAMAGVAQIASTAKDDLWAFELPDGRGMKRGVEFIAPYIADKASWPYAQDVLYWDEWPVRHPSILLGGLHFGREDWIGAWKDRASDPVTFEVLRNLPMRHPVIWGEGVKSGHR